MVSSLKKKVVYKWENGRVPVAPEEMQNEAIRKIYNSCHFVVFKTEELVKQKFYFPKLRKRVEIRIINFAVCIFHNEKHSIAEEFWNPI